MKKESCRHVSQSKAHKMGSLFCMIYCQLQKALHSNSCKFLWNIIVVTNLYFSSIKLGFLTGIGKIGAQPLFSVLWPGPKLLLFPFFSVFHYFYAHKCHDRRNISQIIFLQETKTYLFHLLRLKWHFFNLVFSNFFFLNGTNFCNQDAKLIRGRKSLLNSTDGSISHN